VALNKNHPDYQEYYNKCKALAEEYSEKILAIDFKPMLMDDVREYNLRKEFLVALKALKQEYYYLYTEEEYNSKTIGRRVRFLL